VQGGPAKQLVKPASKGSAELRREGLSSQRDKRHHCVQRDVLGASVHPASPAVLPSSRPQPGTRVRRSQRIRVLCGAAQSAHASPSLQHSTPAMPTSPILLEPHQTNSPVNAARPPLSPRHSPSVERVNQRHPLHEVQPREAVLIACGQSKAASQHVSCGAAQQPAPQQSEPNNRRRSMSLDHAQPGAFALGDVAQSVRPTELDVSDAIAGASISQPIACGNERRPVHAAGAVQRVRRTANGLIPAAMPPLAAMSRLAPARHGESQHVPGGSRQQDCWTAEQLEQLRRAHCGLAPSVQNLWQHIAREVPGEACHHHPAFMLLTC
jgi:hypothetical protein